MTHSTFVVFNFCVNSSYSNPFQNDLNIEINMDTNGPNGNEILIPIKSSEPIDTALIITQIKSLSHYTDNKSDQNIDYGIVREVDCDDDEL